MKKSSSPNPTPRRHDFHRPPPSTHVCGWPPRPVYQRPYHQRRPRFHPHAARIDRPPEPYFRVELRLGRSPLHRDDVEALIDKCHSRHDSFSFYPVDDVAAVLSYRSWEQALDAVVWFWEARLAEKHDFTPTLDSNVVVVNDVDCRLRPVFARHVKGLTEGKEVKRWMEESERLSKEIRRLSSSLRNPLRLGAHNELVEKKKGLDDENNLVERRLKEFESAMQCLLKYLEGGDDVEGVNVFKFDGGFDWERIHCLIKRECRRLEDGLPIYAYRSDILQNIHCQQMEGNRGPMPPQLRSRRLQSPRHCTGNRAKCGRNCGC